MGYAALYSRAQLEANKVLDVEKDVLALPDSFYDRRHVIITEDHFCSFLAYVGALAHGNTCKSKLIVIILQTDISNT